jgi:hypothetical protein
MASDRRRTTFIHPFVAARTRALPSGGQGVEVVDVGLGGAVHALDFGVGGFDQVILVGDVGAVAVAKSWEPSYL